MFCCQLAEDLSNNRDALIANVDAFAQNTSSYRLRLAERLIDTYEIWCVYIRERLHCPCPDPDQYRPAYSEEEDDEGVGGGGPKKKRSRKGTDKRNASVAGEKKTRTDAPSTKNRRAGSETKLTGGTRPESATTTGTTNSTRYGSGVGLQQSRKGKRRAVDDAGGEGADEAKAEQSAADSPPPKKRARVPVEKFSYLTHS